MPVYQIEFYTEPSGRQPVLEWLRGLVTKAREVITAKVNSLKMYGLSLLGTKMMKRIENGNKDFYELRGGSCRIALYHDTMSESFILLHGFLKKRQRETKEIGLAGARIREYQSRR